MEEQNFYELCRLCLMKSECKYSLLASNIVEKVSSIAAIEIKEDDDLPTSCCELCFTNISKFYEFKQGILSTDKILRDMLYQIKSNFRVSELVKESPELFEVLHLDADDNVIKTETEFVEEVFTYYNSTDPKCETISKHSSNKRRKAVKDTFNDDSGSNVFDEDDNAVCTDQIKMLSCEICNKKLPTRQRFQRHMQGHKVEMCPVCCLVIRRDNLKKHVQMHGSSHEICDICGKIAKNRESLRGHIYYTHRDINKQITCEYCSKEFKHNNHYLAHVRNVHLDIRNEQCHLCGKKFSNGYALRKHISMTHNGSRPHVCQYCKKGFSSPYALKTHIRQHTHETPYPCEFCDQAFRQKVSLVTHLKSKHSVELTKKDEPI